jgi:SAM-dependent methyltransferase
VLRTAPYAANHDRLADAQVLRYCSQGPTLDLGCGPRRFTASLQQRGFPALGVDTSRAAVELTRQRGGTAIHADLFAPLPARNGWPHVGLAPDPGGCAGKARLRQALAPRDEPDFLMGVGAPVADFGSGVRAERHRWPDRGESVPGPSTCLTAPSRFIRCIIARRSA